MYCPKCGCKFREGFTVCSDCKCALVETFDEDAFYLKWKQTTASYKFSQYIAGKFKLFTGYVEKKSEALYRTLLISLLLLSFFNYDAKFLYDFCGWEVPPPIVAEIMIWNCIMILLAVEIFALLIVGFPIIKKQSFLSKVFLFCWILINGAVFDVEFTCEWEPVVAIQSWWAGLILMISIFLFQYLNNDRITGKSTASKTK